MHAKHQATSYMRKQSKDNDSLDIISLERIQRNVVLTTTMRYKITLKKDKEWFIFSRSKGIANTTRQVVMWDFCPLFYQIRQCFTCYPHMPSK